MYINNYKNSYRVFLFRAVPGIFCAELSTRDEQDLRYSVESFAQCMSRSAAHSRQSIWDIGIKQANIWDISCLRAFTTRNPPYNLARLDATMKFTFC